MFAIRRAGHCKQSVLGGMGTGDMEDETRDNVQIMFLEVGIAINASLSFSSI